MEKEKKPYLFLDAWQKDFIAEKGNKVLVSGRQTGKSEAAGIDNAEFAACNPKTTCLIISRTERQSRALLQKALMYLKWKYPSYISKGKDKPTLEKVNLNNKSQIISLPTGLAGEGIRYLTIHKLTADEAQLIPDEVFVSTTPMLLTTGGGISLLGTPQGQKGFFWEAYCNKHNQFKVFHINSEEVHAARQISATWPQWRKDAVFRHLSQEKARMTEKQYQQEYLGMFVEDVGQWYSNELIKSCVAAIPEMHFDDYYLGVDVGIEAESAFMTIGMKQKEGYVKNISTHEKEDLIASINMIKNLDLRFNYGSKSIGIDDQGIGAGVLHPLLHDSHMRRKVVGLNNSRLAVEHNPWKEKPQSRRLLGEDMHLNLKRLMEEGKIKFPDDDRLLASLQSVQYEIIKEGQAVGKLKFFGNYTHLAEALKRAAWLSKEKSLNLFVSSIKI